MIILFLQEVTINVKLLFKVVICSYDQKLFFSCSTHWYYLLLIIKCVCLHPYIAIFIMTISLESSCRIMVFFYFQRHITESSEEIKFVICKLYTSILESICHFWYSNTYLRYLHCKQLGCPQRNCHHVRAVVFRSFIIN